MRNMSQKGWTRRDWIGGSLALGGAASLPAAAGPATPASLAPSAAGGAGRPVFRIGVNLGLINDWSSELPFVDLMRIARPWSTRDGSGTWDTGHAARLRCDADGYPIGLPQTVDGKPVWVQTVWTNASLWPTGRYTVLHAGQGEIRFLQGAKSLKREGPGRWTFELDLDAPNAPLVLHLTRSKPEDPLRDLRVLMPGHEASHREQPFNPAFLRALKPFDSVRFMDWGATNNWGQKGRGDWDQPELFDADRRQTPGHYTWADGRGVPYEVMIRLMNAAGLDGWVNVPHRASPGYIRHMATTFRDGLNRERKLVVEYSNETWNWAFGQTKWLGKHGEASAHALRANPLAGSQWPERMTGHVQRCLDLWTEVYGAQRAGRLIRVAGGQTASFNQSKRVLEGLRPGSFDAMTASWYFSLKSDFVGSVEAGVRRDGSLDRLGEKATVADIAAAVRGSWERDKDWLRKLHERVAKPLGLPVLYYEGGQHLTPQPHGYDAYAGDGSGRAGPRYREALVDAMRSPEMGQLYREWFDFMQQEMARGPEPLWLMHFGFIAPLKANTTRFGLFSLLERVDQDPAGPVPAPRYQAVIEAMQRRR